MSSSWTRWTYRLDVLRGRRKPVAKGEPVPGTGKLRWKYDSRDDWSLGKRGYDPFNRAARERKAKRHEDRSN